MDGAGEPQDMAGTVIYLAPGASDLVTGHIFLPVGGWTVH